MHRVCRLARTYAFGSHPCPNLCFLMASVTFYLSVTIPYLSVSHQLLIMFLELKVSSAAFVNIIAISAIPLLIVPPYLC